MSALIGHNIGSEKPERAKKIGDRAVMLGVGIMLAFGLIVFVFPLFRRSAYARTNSYGGRFERAGDGGKYNSFLEDRSRADIFPDNPFRFLADRYLVDNIRRRFGDIDVVLYLLSAGAMADA